MRTRSIAYRVRIAAPILALGLLSGCSILNGNVKGNFACRAPDGTCAPTSRIDDAAVALLVGETAEEARPATVHCAGGQCNKAVARAVNAPQRRTGEKVLRIMFPSYIDDLGRLHEASAIHTVVESGDWVPAGEVAHVPDAISGATPRVAAPLAGTAMAAPPLRHGNTPSAAVAEIPGQVETESVRPPTSVEEVRAKVEAVLARPKRDTDADSKPSPSMPSQAVSPEASATGAVPIRAPGLPGAPEED